MRKDSFEGDQDFYNDKSSDNDIRCKRVQITKNVLSSPVVDSDVGVFGPDLQNLFKTPTRQDIGSDTPFNPIIASDKKM